MRPTTEKFKINGVPMLAPDADVGISYEDLDTAEAGGTKAASCTDSLCVTRLAPGPFPTAI